MGAIVETVAPSSRVKTGLYESISKCCGRTDRTRGKEFSERRRRREAHTGMFKLLKYFSIASAVAVTAAIAVLSVGTQLHVNVDIVETAERQNHIVARTVANLHWSKLLKIGARPRSDTDHQNRPEVTVLEQAISEMLRGTPVLSLTMYDANGAPIYSQTDQRGSDATLSAVSAENDPILTGVLQDGTPASKLSAPERFFSAFGWIKRLHIVESYLPVKSKGGDIEGVIRISSDVTEMAADVHRESNRENLLWVALIAALYLALIFIIRHADRVLKRQHADLERRTGLAAKNRELEQEISVRQRAQGDLKISESRFRDIAAVASDWFWELGPDLRFTYLAGKGNRNADEHLIGLTLREQAEVSRWIFDETELATVELDLGNHRPINEFEYQVRDKAGALHYFSASGMPFFDDRGQFMGFRGVSTVVTAARQAGAAISENEQRFRDLMGRLGEGVSVRDPDGVITYANQRFAEMLGYSPEELIGTHTELLQPDQESSHYRSELERRRLGMADPYEKQFQRKDGSLVTLALIPEVVLDERGEYTGSIIIARDITEQKVAAPLQFALDNLDSGIGLLDTELNLTACNRAMRDGAGITMDDVRRGMSYADMLRGTPTLREVDPERVDAILADRLAAMARRESFVRETGKDQQGRSFQLNFDPLSDGGYAITLTDITDRQRAEAALRESEEQFRTVIDAVPIGIAKYDADSRLVLANRFITPAKVDPVNVIGRHLREIIGEDAYSRAHAHVEQVLAGESVEFENQMPDPSGRKLHIVISYTPDIDADGKVIGFYSLVRDATEQTWAEEDLRLSETRYEEIYNRAPVMIHSLGSDGRLISVSDFWLQTLGYRRDEVVGQPITNIITEATHPEFYEGSLPALRSGREVTGLSHQFIKKSGEVIDVLVRALPELNRDGTFVRTLTVAIDVTEAKRAEAALTESEARFRGIFENSGLAMAMSGPTGHYTMVNDSYCKFLGHGRDEVVGRHVAELSHPDEQQMVEDTRSQAEDGILNALTLERRFIHKDGSTRWGMTSVLFQRGPEGDVVGAITQIQDITETKRAEFALRQSEERFRGVFESSGVGMCIISPAGTFILINDSYCDFLGYSRDELMGASADVNAHIDDVEMLRATRRKLFSGGVAEHSFERRYIHKDGSIVWGIATLICARDENGNPSHLVAQVQDITQRKEQEVALRQQEDRLRLSLDTAAIGTWVLDYVENGHYWDVRTRQIFGIDDVSDDLETKQAFLSAVHPEDEARVRGEMTSAESGDGAYACEFRIVRPDGELRHITSRGTVVRDSRDRALRMIGACMDITDVKMAEEQLRVNHERLARLHEITSDIAVPIEEKIDRLLELGRATFGLPVGIVAECCGDDLCVVQAAGAGASLPIGTKIPVEKTYCAPVLSAARPLAIQDASQSPLVKQIAYETLQYDAYLGAPIVVADEVWGTVSFLAKEPRLKDFESADTTFIQLMAEWIGGELSRTRSALALNESEQRFRDIAESASDWFWEMDAENRYKYQSARGLELFSISSDEVVGMSWRELLAQRDLEVDPDEMEDQLGVLRDEQAFSDFSYSILDRSGERIYVESSGRPYYNSDGEFLGYRGVSRDVTSRWKAQEELIQAMEEAELADQAKSRFLASASHDLRQPLQALNLFVSALSEMESDPAKGELISKTQTSIDALAGLLNALLDISKLEAGLIVPSVAMLGFDRIVQLAEEFIPVANAKGLELEVVPASLVFESDPILLETILRNLLTNAVKYTDSGKVLIGCRRKPGVARIEIWDTGAGIPLHQIELIFEEFYQVGNSARDRELGLGLGLSIVKRTADLLGHSIEVKSEPGRGSMFAIEVPLVDLSQTDSLPEPPADQVSSRVEPELVVHSGKVILIDDEPSILDSMELVLTNMGYDVTACQCSGPNCPDYLDLADRCGAAPDLIVTDYRLPEGMTGIDAVKGLRDKYNSEIPAILISGDISEETLLEVNLHNLTMLHKPVHARELRSVISEMVQNGA